MYIRAMGVDIPVKTIFSETVYYKEATRPSLRIELDGGIATENIALLQQNEWHILSDDKMEQSTYDGYSEVLAHTITFVQMDQVEIQNKALTEGLNKISVAMPELLKTRDDDLLVEFIQYIPQWTPDHYMVGDLRKDSGCPFKCIFEHDSVVNPDWGIRTGTLWAPYHARSAEYALSWIQPTGAHDMYKQGEYVIFDDKVYGCTQNTNFSPTEYPQAWALQNN